MKAGLKARARAFFRRHFPERQIYLRSHGRVQFVVLTPVQQGIMASMLLAVLGWLAYASVSTVFHREIVASLEGRIADLKSAHEAEMARARFDYEELNATLTLAEERFGQMTASLEARQRDLEVTFAQGEAADATLESVRARLARVALFDLGGGRDAPAHEALPEEEIVPEDALETAPGAAPDTGSAEEGTGGPETDNAADDAASAPVAPPAPAPADEEDHSDAAPVIDEPVTRTASRGTSATVQLNPPATALRSTAFARAASKSYLGRRLAAIDGRLMDLEDDQAALAAAMRAAIDEKVERTLSAFDLTAVNVAKLVPPAQTQIGGPFIPADGISLADLPLQGVGAQAQFDMLSASMARFDRMNEVLLSTPLALPLRAHTSLSSGFGTRSDPFSRRSAFHAGLDFRGQYGTPIHATAPGRVLTAERRGPYGLMVEIDHGNGIRTRYGHMQSLAVSAGQEIAFGQIVGTLGSTGRSTGPHLHYEVWYDGAARNPVSFLKAGQHVFER